MSTTQDQRERASMFLLSSLRDPDNPLHCGVCIVGAFIQCISDERGTSRERFRSHQKSTYRPECVPKLWNAIIGFMFHKRSDIQMTNLVDRMADCKCQMTGRSGSIEQYHRIGAQDLQERYIFATTETEERHPALRLYTVARCGWVSDIFLKLSMVVLATRIKAAAKGSSTTWPISLSDLFPFGMDNFVQSSLQWHHHVPDPIIFHFVGSVVRACHMLVIPSLIKYQFTSTVVQSTREMIDRAMIDISHRGSPATIRVSRCRLSWHAASTVIYFRSLNIRAYPALLHGHEAKGFQLFSVMIYLAKEWESICGTLDSGLLVDVGLCVTTAHNFYRFYHLHLSPLPPFQVHPLLVQSDMDSFITSWAWELKRENSSIVKIIRTFRRSEQCSAQGCTGSLQLAGRDFQRCRGCRVVTYCGRECQRNAWKREPYLHKHVCSALKNLVEKGGGYSLFFSEDTKNPDSSKNYSIVDNILQNWKTAIIDSDLLLVEDWANTVNNSKIYPRTTEWTPGYEDYEEIIAQLSGNGRGLKPVYITRAVQWPEDVARDKRLLKVQPFWGQCLDF